MPLYSYRCPRCGAAERAFRKIENRNVGPGCCGTAMQKIVEAPRVAPDLPPYTCPITGDWISGRAAHENNLAKHGCRVLEAGEREAVERRRRQADTALESAIEATIEKEIHEMPARKREKLEAQLDNFNLSVGKA